MRMSQTQIILSVLRREYPNCRYSYDLHKTQTEFGWIGPTGERRCRELRQAGLIEQRDVGRFVQYRAVGPRGVEVIRDAATGEVLRRVAVYG
jgi:hypothetical protein